MVGIGTNKMTYTENGAAAHSTTHSALVDFFFAIGGFRQNGVDTTTFSKIPQELALRMALYLRDARGGAGERKAFRDLIPTIEEYLDPVGAINFIGAVIKVGRFDDLLHFKKYKHSAYSAIALSLANGNGLCAKWLPRQDRDGAKELRKFLELSPKEYRQLLVSLSNTVEQKMSAGDWDSIEFGHVPSVAASRLQKAFLRNAPEAYSLYKTRLEIGEDKVNASAVFPHDVVKALMNGDRGVSETQWKCLPNFLEGSKMRMLPVVDVSSSMNTLVSGQTSAKDIAVSLGIYIAERNEGQFKDQIISFSGNPNFHDISGSTLYEKVRKVMCSGENMNTNLLGVFQQYLRVAKNTPVEQHPEALVLISDMQFDSVNSAEYDYRKHRREDQTPIQRAKSLFTEAGIKMPTLVFWNVDSNEKTFPVTDFDNNVVLVGGFSPAILKTVLSFDPSKTAEDVVLETLMNERYDWRKN